MVNVRLDLEYNGANFHGWQVQPGLRTVEGELLEAVRTISRQPVRKLIGCSRLDAGVHARNHVVNFELSEDTNLKKLKVGVSNIMKGELSITSAAFVPNDFHARRNAKFKEYRYFLINRPSPPVLAFGKAWHVYSCLDLEKMRAAAAQLVGEHDFSSFRGSDCSAKTVVRTLHKVQIRRYRDYFVFIVIGNAFLKQMVRNIVGTLVDIGRGHLERDIQDILDDRQRLSAGVTAPSQGLFLWKVGY